eukprot:2122799-Rhodomonas_salina.1
MLPALLRDLQAGAVNSQASTSAAVNVMQGQREIESLRSHVKQKQREHKELEVREHEGKAGSGSARAAGEGAREAAEGAGDRGAARSSRRS